MESHVKYFLGIVTVIVLSVASVAGLGWWWARPMAFVGEIDAQPGNPGSFTRPEGHGQPSRLEIYRLLNGEQFAELTRIIEAKTSLAQTDVRNEADLGRVLDAFAIDDPAMAALFDRWVTAQPGSFAPYLARGIQSFALSFLERGTASAQDTSQEQFAGMARHLERAGEDARKALDLNARLPEAYKLLVDLARAQGNQRACGEFAAAGLTISPATVRVRRALAICRLPRWGGSHAAVRAIALNAAPFFAENPDLTALAGFAAWDQARIAEGDAAVALFDEAIKAGPYWQFHFDRAREHFAAGRFDAVVADTTEALRLNPQDPAVLLLHVRAMNARGRASDVSAELELLKEIDGANPRLQAFLTEQQHPTRRERSGADAHYWRGRAHVKAGNHDAALPEFLEATRIDPEHFESYRNIDYIYATRNEWAPIVEHWDQYLSRKPDDARALFERSGTHYRMRNLPAAKTDVTRACDLGLEEACAQMKRVGWN